MKKAMILTVALVVIVLMGFSVSAFGEPEVISHYGEPDGVDWTEIYAERNANYAEYAQHETDHRQKLEELELQCKILYGEKELEKDNIRVYNNTNTRASNSTILENKNKNGVEMNGRFLPSK